MSTNPTNVPAKNHNNEDIPPLPYLHVKVHDTSTDLELRIITPRRVLCIDGGQMHVSDYAVVHGLLGLENGHLVEKT